VWASLARSPEEVIGEMFEEAACRDPTQQKRGVALVDGNLPQLAHLERLAEKRGVPLVIVIDLLHVAQQVWKAAGALFPGQECLQDRWTREHWLEIFRGKASRVAGGMRRSATRREMGAERQPVEECADYLLRYSPYLRHDQALAEGVLIATGVIGGVSRVPKRCFGCAPVKISTPLGDFTDNRNSNVTTHPVTPITVCLVSCHPCPSRAGLPHSRSSAPKRVVDRNFQRKCFLGKLAKQSRPFTRGSVWF
jgi:hypothetical protein